MNERIIREYVGKNREKIANVSDAAVLGGFKACLKAAGVPRKLHKRVIELEAAKGHMGGVLACKERNEPIPKNRLLKALRANKNNFLKLSSDLNGNPGLQKFFKTASPAKVAIDVLDKEITRFKNMKGKHVDGKDVSKNFFESAIEINDLALQTHLGGHFGNYSDSREVYGSLVMSLWGFSTQ